MDEVSVTELRQELAEYLAKVQRGKTVSIKQRGKVIAKLVPAEDTRAAAKRQLAEWRKTSSVGDVVSPIDVEWEALKK